MLQFHRKQASICKSPVSVDLVGITRALETIIVEAVVFVEELRLVNNPVVMLGVGFRCDGGNELRKGGGLVRVSEAALIVEVAFLPQRKD